jgi:uncharacterized protein YukE
MLPGGGGVELGPGAVVVTPDPGLMEADPGAMTAAASTFGTAAHQVYSVATATSGAAGQLAAGWTGQGVAGFKAAASDTSWYSSSAAEGLMGACLALRALARSITGAQTLARAAIALAEQTTLASAALNTAFVNSQTSAVAALPAKATAAQVDQALAPTSGQLAHADMLSADASRAVTMMNQANNEARTAWHVAASAFDAVTAQSPSVQLAALKIRVKNMSNSLDSAGIEAIMMMTSGMAYGSVLGGDGEDDDDDISPEMLSELENDAPMLAANIEDEEKMTVDGVPMDGAVAADIEGNGTTAWTDAEIAALSPATDDPVTGGLISQLASSTDDPETLAKLISPSLGEDPAHGGEFNPSEYQTALRVEAERDVVLRRSSQPELDWDTEDGTTYDAVGNFPGRYLSSQWRNFTAAIAAHVAKADYVPVDVSQFSPEQIEMIEEYIKQYGSHVFLVGR